MKYEIVKVEVKGDKMYFTLQNENEIFFSVPKENVKVCNDMKHAEIVIKRQKREK